MQKSKIRYIFLDIVVLYIILFSSGCVSKPGRAGTEDDVLAYQRRVTELEVEVRELREELSLSNQRFADDLEKLDKDIRGLEEIRAESAGITDSVDRAIFLFDNYESVVERIVRDYREIRNRVEAIKEDSSNSD